METTAIESFIRQSPKVELHLHIEGTLEPEQMPAREGFQGEARHDGDGEGIERQPEGNGQDGYGVGHGCQ